MGEHLREQMEEKWWKMVKNGGKWGKMKWKWGKWWKLGGNGGKWGKMVENGLKIGKNWENGGKWGKMGKIGKNQFKISF